MAWPTVPRCRRDRAHRSVAGSGGMGAAADIRRHGHRLAGGIDCRIGDISAWCDDRSVVGGRVGCRSSRPVHVRDRWTTTPPTTTVSGWAVTSDRLMHHDRRRRPRAPIAL
jgi:hypothetical protein